MKDKCLHLEVDYSFFLSKRNVTDQTSKVITYKTAVQVCASIGGTLANVDKTIFDKLIQYLRLWRFSPRYGSIWIQTSQPLTGQQCSVIYVSLTFFFTSHTCTFNIVHT